MFKRFYNLLPLFYKIRPLFCFVISWCLGLLFGVFCADAAGESYISLMRSACFSRVTIVGLFASAYLPFLLCAFAVYVRRPKALYLISFLKAILFAQCSFALSLCFGSADWLVRFLYAFTDLFSVPFLCWFCFRHIFERGYSLRRDFLICTGAWCIAAGIDYCVVSPFLVMLIDI